MSINATKQDEVQKDTPKLKLILRLFRYMTSYKKEIILVTISILAALVISTINPLLLEHAIDVNIKNGDWMGLCILVGINLALSVAYVFIAKFWQKIMARVSNNVLVTIRDELYVHIQSLSFSFFDSRPIGKIIARVIGDVNSLKDVIHSTVVQLIPDTLTVIVVLTIMLIKNPLLTLAAVASIPIICLGMYFAEIVAHKRWMDLRKKKSKLTAYVHEDFSGIGVVQSFTAEEETANEFSMFVEDHRKSFRSCVFIADMFSPTIEISWGVGSFLLYFFGIQVLGVDKIGIGTFTAFSLYMGMFWGPIRNLANYYNKLVTNLSAAERVFDIMDTPAEVADREDAYDLPEVQGSVDFKQVTFAYPDEPEVKVLHNVSFHVNPGQTIALVGPTGAGKTTIVNLISRFYNATDGQVCVDAHNLQDVTIHSLRKQMGVMTQDTFLFSGTIRENLRYGRLDATDEEIEAAAKAVHAHNFIMQMEKGYDTEISERGARLSVGQRQLLAFARTMVSDPKILILDEATSSIDTHTEILVQQGIESLLAGRTSFVIAHRLSTIKNADRIMVIDEGGILEAGTHDELMAKKGAYFDLYQAQFKNIGVDIAS